MDKMNYFLTRILSKMEFDEAMLKKLQRLGCCTPKGAPVGEHEYSEVCACELEDLARDNYARLQPIIKAQNDALRVMSEALVWIRGAPHTDGPTTTKVNHALIEAEQILEKVGK